MFLDIGLSFFYSILVTKMFDIPLTHTIVLFGIFFALIPDIDTPIELIQRGKLGGKESGFHRKYTHFPFVYILITIIIWIFFAPFWAVLFCFNILSHFIHDSIWTGWGIQWLWPFSNDSFKLFSDKDGTISTNLMTSWSPQELKDIMHAKGNDNWFKDIYLNFSPVLMVELLAFILGLLLLFYVVN